MRLASAVHGGLLLSCKLHFTPGGEPAWKLQEEMQSVVPCTCAACSDFDKKEPEACYRSAGKWFHKEGRQVTVRINGPRKPGNTSNRVRRRPSFVVSGVDPPVRAESNYQSQSDRKDYGNGVSIPEDLAEVPTETRLSRCLDVGSRTSTNTGLLRHRRCCRLVT